MKITTGKINKCNLNPMLLLNRNSFYQWYDETRTRFSQCLESMKKIRPDLVEHLNIRYAIFWGQPNQITLEGGLWTRGIEFAVYSFLGAKSDIVNESICDSENRLVTYKSPIENFTHFISQANNTFNYNHRKEKPLSLSSPDEKALTKELYSFYEDIHKTLTERSAKVYLSLLGRLNI